ncbi:hypothetical protein [Psychromonas sp. MME2]|uniref:hypothetical protein n=1 Tax=Psychromonas sp. MME2 TaxID=3231033 RepID=UPI00339CF29A
MGEFNEMYIVRTSFLVFGSLVGCATLHDELVENPTLSTVQRVERIAVETNSDVFDIDNETCTSLLECAVYLNDYALAEWIVNNIKLRQYYIASEWKFKSHIIYAPLRYNLSDAEASRYFKLFISHGFNPNVCDYGSVRPITFAFRKGYIESFKVLLAESDILLNGQKKQQLTHCADTSLYIDDLFRLDFSKELRRELTNDAIWKATKGSLLSSIIRVYDKATPSQAEMLFLLLEAMNNPDQIYIYHNTYRCDHYSSDSALAYATCLSKNEVVNLLTAYYLSTNKFTDDYRQYVFRSADSTIKATLSDAELRAKNAKIARENEAYRRKLRKQFDKAFNEEPASYNLSEFRSVSEQLGTDSFSNIDVNSSATQNSNKLVDFDFHLYVDSVGVKEKPEQKKTYFVGETCKRYPWASTCQNKVNKPNVEEGYWDCNVFVKGKKTAEESQKSQRGKVCVE